jgi:hypothetical protein
VVTLPLISVTRQQPDLMALPHYLADRRYSDDTATARINMRMLDQ